MVVEDGKRGAGLAPARRHERRWPPRGPKTSGDTEESNDAAALGWITMMMACRPATRSCHSATALPSPSDTRLWRRRRWMRHRQCVGLTAEGEREDAGQREMDGAMGPWEGHHGRHARERSSEGNAGPGCALGLFPRNRVQDEPRCLGPPSPFLCARSEVSVAPRRVRVRVRVLVTRLSAHSRQAASLRRPAAGMIGTMPLRFPPHHPLHLPLA